MSRNIILQDTVNAINEVAFALHNHYALVNKGMFRMPPVTTASELDSIRSHLLFLDESLRRSEFEMLSKAFIEGRSSSRWLYYEAEEEVIPVYNEGIGVSVIKQIVEPTQIPYLIAFMGILGGRYGVDVENHSSKGFHFHYGKIRNNSLKRYDVLLTFDKNRVKSGEPEATRRPLYIEPHASGKNTHIDASTIGNNRRLPIYLVCKKAMLSRGLENFLPPSRNASVFYPVS